MLMNRKWNDNRIWYAVDIGSMLGCSEEFNVSFGFIGVKGKAIKNRVDQFN